VNACVQLIMKEIDRLKNERVPASVLHDAKEYTKGNLLMAEESPDNQMVRLAQNEFYFDHYVSMQSVIDSVDAVQADDLLALADDLWNGAHPALTVLGPDADRLDLVVG